MTRRAASTIGAGLLAVLWLGPLPGLSGSRFSAHMLLHMGVVAAAAPLLALAIRGTRADPVDAWPRLLHPITASIAELIVVWGWHAPRFHLAARRDAEVLALEQVSFLIAGLWLWLAACRGGRRARAQPWRGVAALLFTSVHMTLLAALFALSSRDVYGQAGASSHEQQVGGSLMLLIGGGSYLAGGLWLAHEGLTARPGLAAGAAARRGGALPS